MVKKSSANWMDVNKRITDQSWDSRTRNSFREFYTINTWYGVRHNEGDMNGTREGFRTYHENNTGSM